MFERQPPHGFDCSQCTRAQQRAWGCGTPPVVREVDARGCVVESEWSLAAWLEAGAKDEPAYRWAPLGGVIEVLGPAGAWDRCPRWYDPRAGFVSLDDAEEAERLLEMRRWLERGELARVHAAELTPREAAELECADALVLSLRIEAERRKADEMRSKAKSKAGGA